MAPSRRPASPPSDVEHDSDHTPPDTDPSSALTDLLTHDLVRLALAAEYSRTPLRRADITTRIFTPHGAPARLFRPVFDATQLALRHTFGMELVELPARDKVTLAARRKEATALAQAQPSRKRRGGPIDDAAADDEAPSSTQHNGQQTSSSTQKSWVLMTVLPPGLQGDATGVGPSKAPTEETEAAYAGLCALVVALIVLAGGALAQGKLDRHLRRANAETSVPLDRTERVLARMIREGYIVRVKENSGGEEVVEYYVGPRGKVEIGEGGVEGLVRMAYEDEEGMDDAELERRLERSMRVGGFKSSAAVQDGGDARRVRTRANDNNNDDDDDD